MSYVERHGLKQPRHDESNILTEINANHSRSFIIVD